MPQIDSTRRRLMAAGLAMAGSALAGRVSAQLPPEVLRIAIDAEFNVKAASSAQAIALGVRAAVAEINAGGGVLGRPLEVVTRNNNSSPARARDNLRELAADPAVMAVMGGKHSPVYLELLPLIHGLGMPYLDPWAAADGITRHAYRPGYVFRLSLLDSWAIAHMIDFARTRRMRRLGALLPNSSWGRSCRAAIQHRLAGDAAVHLVSEQWYSFGDEDLRLQCESLHGAGAEFVIMVANEIEGAHFVRVLAEQAWAQQLPVLAHWGITGGQFHALAGGALDKVDLRVVQTFSFLRNDSAAARRLLATLSTQFGANDARRIESPVGVAHAYDLTYLLARAIKQAGRPERHAVRDAMLALPAHRGAVRDYQRPFSEGDYDALEPGDIFLARYAPDGAIEPER